MNIKPPYDIRSELTLAIDGLEVALVELPVSTFITTHCAERMRNEIKRLHTVMDELNELCNKMDTLTIVQESWRKRVAKLEADNDFGVHCQDEFTYAHGERNAFNDCIDDIQTLLPVEDAPFKT